MKIIIASLLLCSLVFGQPPAPGRGGPPPPPAPSTSLTVPLTGSKWTLYDLGAADKCGASTCGGVQTLPNSQSGALYFNLPVAPDMPEGGALSNPTFSGTGPDDANWDNSYYSGPAGTYCATIIARNAYSDGAGWHDEYSYGVSPGCSNLGTGYIQSTQGSYLFDGLLLTWSTMGGHAVGSTWGITASVGTQNSDWRGYLVTGINGKFSESQTLTVTIQVATTGNPVFGYDSESDNTCVNPATIRPYFQSGSFLSTNSDGSNRWWSNPVSYTLANGIATLTIPLAPANWSDTYGQIGTAVPAEFSKALGGVSWIGLTMGGGCFYGHSANVSGGTAQVSLTHYSVQ